MPTFHCGEDRQAKHLPFGWSGESPYTLPFMKRHIKIAAFAFKALGVMTWLFILLILLLQGLSSFGIMHDKSPSIGWTDALVVVFVLGIPALWCVRTGLGLQRFNRFARLSAILIAAILFVGLDVVLLMTEAHSHTLSKTAMGFHLAMILLGVYILVVLLSKQGKSLFA